MHYNIPSDKIMLFGLLTAVTIVAFFLVARLKNAGWGGRKKKKAVQEAARNFEVQLRNGIAMDGRKTTLKEFTKRWLEEYAPQNLQPGTIEKYEDEIDKFMLALGHYKLADLRPHILNSFFVSLSKPGARKDGKPGGYAKSSIARTRSVLSSILRTAAEWEIIEKNPCDLLRFQAEDAAEKIKFFTPEQTSIFLEYIEQPFW